MSNSRPVIGITAAYETARWAVWEEIDVNISQRTYTNRVDEAGGVPLLLPTSQVGTADPGAIVERIDALLLSGGADLDPDTYGAEPNPKTTNFKAARDSFEIALCREAIDRGMPVLGVCRGFQVLNVALGGDLDQHLDDADVHVHTPGTFSDHEIVLEPGSRAAEVAGTERLSVRSHHHQGVGRLGDGLRATAWAEPGGVIESIDFESGEAWVLGILWHTEEVSPSAVIESFCSVARGSRTAEAVR